ncbi:MAG: envelope stress response membrane protein PspB [Pseudomonadota bacterium]
MEDFGEILGGLLVIFVMFVVPIWIFFHYRWKIAKAKQTLSEDDLQRLNDMQVAVHRMQERLQSLEIILDEKTPDWRRYS